jgi:L-threonylcarbamoyladenylate synthase
MLVLIDDAAKLNTYVREVPDIAWELVEAADKPLTVVYPHGKNLSPALLAEDGSVGIRVTREEFSHKLCWRYRKPLVSTSANISGQTAPGSFREISEEIKQGVDYIVGYGRKEKASKRPSSIIKLEVGNSFQIIRR